MRLHRILLAAGFQLAVFLGASSQPLTPADVAMKILEASPATHANALGIASLSESLKTESNLPDPEIEGEYLFAPGDEKNRWGAGISWGIEWPGVYSARRREVRGKMSAAEAASYKARRERLTEIKRLLLDYVLAEEQLKILKGIKDSNDSITALSEKAERHGELTRLDFNKLRLEQAILSGSMSAVLNSRQEALTQLNIIYGEDCSSLLKSMECSLPEVAVPAEKVDYLQSPAVQTAKAEADASKEALNVARTEAYPGLSIGYQHAYEDGVHFNGATLGISIPLFSSRGKKAAARAALTESEFKVEKAAAEAKAEVEGAERKLIILCRQIEEMWPVVNDPGNTELLMKAYRGGVITLIDYLNERNYFTNASLELVSLRYEAAKLLLDMEAYR